MFLKATYVYRPFSLSYVTYYVFLVQPSLLGYLRRRFCYHPGTRMSFCSLVPVSALRLTAYALVPFSDAVLAALDVVDGDCGRLGHSMLANALCKTLDDPFVHIGVRVLGHQIEDKPVSDVATGEKVVDLSHVLHREGANSRSENERLREYKYGIFRAIKTLPDHKLPEFGADNHESRDECGDQRDDRQREKPEPLDQEDLVVDDVETEYAHRVVNVQVARQCAARKLTPEN